MDRLFPSLADRGPRATAQRGPAARSDRDIERARTFARVLDHYFVDPLLGLVLPGAGDILGSLLGLYIVGLAVRRRMSPLVIARMLLNLGLDAVTGAVPLIGDVVDVGLRANRRNADLLAERSATGGRAKRSDWLALGAALLGFVAVIALVIWAITAVVRAL